jgi:hypothetical protein
MIETVDHAARLPSLDEILAAYLRAVLDDPAADHPRRAYADRLDALGHLREADRVRAQLADPRAVDTAAGAELGLPLAVAVAFRRGFAEAVTVGRDDLTRLGELLGRHPVTSVRVGGTGALLVIVRDGTLWVARMRVGVLAMPGPGHPGLCVGRQDWDDRAGLVAGVGAWAAAAIPPIRWPRAVAPPDPEPVLAPDYRGPGAQPPFDRGGGTS